MGEPLKDSMQALMRLFLCSPDDEEANEGGVSMITPAARPGGIVMRYIVLRSSTGPPCVGRPTPFTEGKLDRRESSNL